MLIRIPKGWEIPEREATPESVYFNRRQLLQAAGLMGLINPLTATESKSPYPAKRNPEFTLDRPITEEWAATGYNNFYEFDPENKQAVKDKVGAFQISPWKVEVTGLVNKPAVFDLDDILRKFPLEERLYRFRCVERWAMAVPWTGFPLSRLIQAVDPKPEAKFVRFTTVSRPKEMPGMQRAAYYPWPYNEGLRMDEAMNPLTLVVTGIYGKPLPKQNGAPIRIVVPWKYGYKSAKSIVRIEFTAKMPGTFWNQMQPSEYGFYSNVNPKKPHPRWSQAYENLIPHGERRPTLMYNGYEQYVAALYNGKED
ncbi:MAG: protein-methionine-sulfoxide reductase catalytic subunit MsrP [Bryobacteraceae bacterium]|nr:protein-methionine-sulfoxide reductase catalytic subunit MsrP [Bryobacteraceae bacterium]MDW8379024.1 protein-methionine-sulfoxide reductase catalytic subunit MsrP [Bryobacterales bacterium]